MKQKKKVKIRLKISLFTVFIFFLDLSVIKMDCISLRQKKKSQPLLGKERHVILRNTVAENPKIVRIIIAFFHKTLCF